MKTTTKLWIGIAVLIALSPLGITIPEYFKAGAAWGEWGTEEIKELTGYIPRGLEKLASLWNAPVPDYAFKGWENAGLSKLSVGYIASGAIGVLLVVGCAYLIGKLLSKK